MTLRRPRKPIGRHRIRGSEFGQGHATLRVARARQGRFHPALRTKAKTGSGPGPRLARDYVRVNNAHEPPEAFLAIRPTSRRRAGRDDPGSAGLAVRGTVRRNTQVAAPAPRAVESSGIG